MGLNNYRMVIDLGISGTRTNPDGLLLDLTDDILPEVEMKLDFEPIAGALRQTLTFTEVSGDLVVDRDAKTIDFANTLPALATLRTDKYGGRTGRIMVVGQDLPDVRNIILNGTVKIVGTPYDQ